MAVAAKIWAGDEDVGWSLSIEHRGGGEDPAAARVTWEGRRREARALEFSDADR